MGILKLACIIHDYTYIKHNYSNYMVGTWSVFFMNFFFGNSPIKIDRTLLKPFFVEFSNVTFKMLDKNPNIVL